MCMFQKRIKEDDDEMKKRNLKKRGNVRIT